MKRGKVYDRVRLERQDEEKVRGGFGSGSGFVEQTEKQGRRKSVLPDEEGCRLSLKMIESEHEALKQ
jgi:hypothetical protein